MKRTLAFAAGLANVAFAAWAYVHLPPQVQAHPGQDVMLGLGFFSIVGTLCMVKALKGGGKAAKGGKSLLDAMVLWWSAGSDAFTVRDLVANVCVLGRTGSGKSSGSGLHLARGILSIAGSGGLILASKPGDKPWWIDLFKKAGRLKDLLIFEPGGDLRFNPIQYALLCGADSREITQMISTVGETLRRNQKSRGGNEQEFWQNQQEMGLYNGVEPIRQATGSMSIPALAEFIENGAISPEQMQDPEWRNGIHYKTLLAAFAAGERQPGDSVEKFDYNQAFSYWTNQWPRMDPKVRTSILAGIMGTLHVLNTGQVRMLHSRDSNVSPAVMEDGKFVLVNASLHEHGASGIAINTLWKHAVQKHILRRHVGPGSNLLVIYSDEVQNWLSSLDWTFTSENRSHLSAFIALTQSIHGLHSSMGQGGGGEHETKALMSNFSTKIFHSVDAETAAFASECVGKEIRQRGSFSNNPSGDLWQDMMGRGSMSYSSREQVEEVLLPRLFMHGLRTGGPPDYVVDGYVVKSGEPFSNGQNFIKVSLSQK